MSRSLVLSLIRDWVQQNIELWTAIAKYLLNISYTIISFLKSMSFSTEILNTDITTFLCIYSHIHFLVLLLCIYAHISIHLFYISMHNMNFILLKANINKLYLKLVVKCLITNCLLIPLLARGYYFPSFRCFSQNCTEIY